MSNLLSVIKIGGSIAEDDNVLMEISEALAAISADGNRLILVHGGGGDISRNLKLIDEEPRFINGLRVTTPKGLDMVEMTLSGYVNKKLTGFLNRVGLDKGVKAVGISGIDSSTFICRPVSEDLGCVGSIFQVNPGLIKHLIGTGYLPVVSPISVGEDHKHYNVNADEAAGALAGSVQADMMVFLSDVPGVLDKDKNLISRLNANQTEALIETGDVTGGMIPKLRSCVSLLKSGVRKVLICGWTGHESFVEGIASGNPVGTLVTN